MPGEKQQRFIEEALFAKDDSQKDSDDLPVRLPDLYRRKRIEHQRRDNQYSPWRNETPSQLNNSIIFIIGETL